MNRGDIHSVPFVRRLGSGIVGYIAVIIERIVLIDFFEYFGQSFTERSEVLAAEEIAICINLDKLGKLFLNIFVADIGETGIVDIIRRQILVCFESAAASDINNRSFVTVAFLSGACLRRSKNRKYERKA